MNTNVKNIFCGLYDYICFKCCLGQCHLELILFNVYKIDLFLFTKCIHEFSKNLSPSICMDTTDVISGSESRSYPSKPNMPLHSFQLIAPIKTTLVTNHYPAASHNSSPGSTRSSTHFSILSGSCCAWCLCFGRLCWAKTDYNCRAVSSEEMLYGGIIA